MIISDHSREKSSCSFDSAKDSLPGHHNLRVALLEAKQSGVKMKKRSETKRSVRLQLWEEPLLVADSQSNCKQESCLRLSNTKCNYCLCSYQKHCSSCKDWNSNMKVITSPFSKKLPCCKRHDMTWNPTRHDFTNHLDESFSGRGEINCTTIYCLYHLAKK